MFKSTKLCNSRSHSKPNIEILKLNNYKRIFVVDYNRKGGHFTKPNCKRSHFTNPSHSLERVKWFWIFDAQIALVPASLSSAGRSVCFVESFLLSQVGA